MFTTKLTTYLLVLSIAGFCVTADQVQDECFCDTKLVDGQDAAPGSNAAGGVGGIGANGKPGCPGCPGGRGGAGDGSAAGGVGGLGGNGGAATDTKRKRNNITISKTYCYSIVSVRCYVSVRNKKKKFVENSSFIKFVILLHIFNESSVFRLE